MRGDGQVKPRHNGVGDGWALVTGAATAMMTGLVSALVTGAVSVLGVQYGNSYGR